MKKVILKEYQLSGLSVSAGVACLALGFATLMIGIGKGNFIVLSVGLLLLLLSALLSLSVTKIIVDKELGTVELVYKRFMKTQVQTIALSEEDYFTFYNEKHNQSQINFMITSTNWYPVKNSSYYVCYVKGDSEEDKTILCECIDLKDTFKKGKMFSKALQLQFISSLK